MNKQNQNIIKLIKDLCLIPGLSGYEDEVRKYIKQKLKQLDLKYQTDVIGNLSCTLKGNSKLPSVMIFAHMDQLGFVIKKIENNGLLRVERLGGVPEKTLPSTSVLVKNNNGKYFAGVIGNKSHHATAPEEKYVVPTYRELFVDCGFSSKKEVERNGILIGCPITYKPSIQEINTNKLAGTSLDDRAGCAVILELAKEIKKNKNRPTVHLVFSVQEEFNLRGVIPIAKKLQPQIAIQLDIMLASDTPDMKKEGDIELGKGPCISLYSFHGRGTLNGLIPHPNLINLITSVSKKNKINLQRNATNGLLTDISYIQHLDEGLACANLGFPVRYSHSPNEVCDLRDLLLLKKLLVALIKNINTKFKLLRD